MSEWWSHYRDYWNQHAGNVGPQHAVWATTWPEYIAYYRPIVKKLAPAKVETIFDVGCGAGMMVPLLEELYPKAYYIGLDISPVMITHCQIERPDLDWRLMPNFDLPGKADLIIMHSVLTHITGADAERYLGEIRVALNPGGRASISIHTEPPDGQLLSGDVRRVDYALAFFEALLAKHGLKVIDYVDGLQRYYGVEVAA